MRATRAIVSAALLAIVTAGASAQGRHTSPHAGRIAGIAAPPAQASQPVVYPGQYGSPYYSAPYPAAPVVASIPVVLMPDGRIFADFGYGYEPVLRSCAAAAVTYAAPPAQYSPPNYATPSYSVPSYDTPAFSQPAPAQPTAADQMLAGMQRAQQPAQASPTPVRTTSAPVIASCWATDAYGRVMVVRQ